MSSPEGVGTSSGTAHISGVYPCLIQDLVGYQTLMHYSLPPVESNQELLLVITRVTQFQKMNLSSEITSTNSSMCQSSSPQQLQYKHVCSMDFGSFAHVHWMQKFIFSDILLDIMCLWKFLCYFSLRTHEQDPSIKCVQLAPCCVNPGKQAYQKMSNGIRDNLTRYSWADSSR